MFTMISVQILCYFLSAVVFVTARDNHHYYWRDYWGNVPHDGVSFAGIYVAQISNNGILPASLYPDTKEALTEAYGGKIVAKENIKVLCDLNTENFYWEYTTIDKLTGDYLDDLVVGGDESGSVLYIGRVFHEGVWKIGKVFPADSEYKGFKAWNRDNKQHLADDFQILKYKRNPITPRC